MDKYSKNRRSKKKSSDFDLTVNSSINHQPMVFEAENLKLILEDKLVYKVEKERRPFLFNNFDKLERNYKEIYHLIDQNKIYDKSLEEYKVSKSNQVKKQ